MNVAEAMIAWTPIHATKTPSAGTLKVGPLLQPGDADWTRPFLYTGGASETHVRALTGRKAVARIFIEFNTLVARDGSPFDEGAGPVRYVAIYKDKSVYIFAGSSRSSSKMVPAADRIIVSVAETFRKLRPAEYPLGEPYRLKLLTATARTRMEIGRAHV